MPVTGSASAAMAITCPGCGREYDVTLFRFGRTIDCTCGRRVGVEETIPGWDEGGEPRFIADAMLGRLARWLRVLGYDTAYDDAISDEELVRRAFREGRAILTRDRGLAAGWRLDPLLLLETDDPGEQLREVVERFGLDPSRGLFRRCTGCNAPLEEADPGEVEGEVPAGVLAEREDFSRCPRCGRVYWRGSHTRRMRRRLRALFGGSSGEG